MKKSSKIELCKQYAPECQSLAALCRKLKIKPVGGNCCCLKKFCLTNNIDISHFTGQGHQKGKISNKRKTAEQILILRKPYSHRQKGYILKRSLVSICKS